MTEPMTTSLPTPTEFERLLTRFINGTLLGGKGTVDRDTRLFEDGYMNSLRILDLIAMVEKTLGRRVPDRAVRLANFRSIATIVQTFHPDAKEQAVSLSADRVFERVGDRARFASPLQALIRRGDVHVTAPGCVSLSGLALDVFDAIDRTVIGWARALGAPEHRYPNLIEQSALERAGQQASTVISGQRESARLAPAVCYHTYPEFSGRPIGEKPELITARGQCYRYEGGQHVPLERLWEFTMREIIVIGTRDQVETTRQSLVRQAIALVEALELDAVIETASDPFFTAGDEGRRLMQQAGALKYELRLAIDETGRAIAVASFNHHHDFFGARFDMRHATGVPAHSGCVAFGLERWVLALFAQHGVEPGSWPNAARTWLADARPRAHGGRS